MKQITMQEIQAAINEERWEEAYSLISEMKSVDAIRDEERNIFAVLEASCYIHRCEYDEAMQCIHNGLAHNMFHYELYFMLGNIKETLGNMAQAMFCYENAAQFAKGEDKAFLEEYLTDFRKRNKNLPGKTAIIIVSYNNLAYTKLCVDSIEQQGIHYPGTYEIIIIDNHSEDGTKEWLEHSSYKYIVNEDNKGFPAACNQGILLADKDSDIFFLNNDTIVMPNSIFCLRMGLYEDEQTGVTGSVSNRVSNSQMITESFDTIEQYVEYAATHNVYDPKAHELRLKLVGFAMMFRRSVLNQIGILDEEFGLGHYEDDDISVRVLKAGYWVKLCRDSFIYHYGNRSFCKRKEEKPEEHHAGIVKNRQYFIDKWGVDLNYYGNIRTEIVDLIQENRENNIKVLEIGCGCGSTLLKIKSEYPKAEVFGVELVEAAAQLIQHMIPIICQNIEDCKLQYPLHSFDYIILGDVLEHLHEPHKTLLYLKDFLAEGGYIIVSIPNIMNYTAIIPLLQGNFDYQDAGILDRTHLRFFTLNSIVKMFHENGFHILGISALNNSISEENKAFIQKMSSLSDSIHEEDFYAYQYLIKAEYVGKE